MHFKRVKIENFLSYKSQEFSDLDRPGLTLIEGRNRDEGGSNGAGKCFAKGTKVLLTNGFSKAVENIVVGDALMGPDSKPRTVVSLGRGRDRMYRVTPNKGEPFTVNSEHILYGHDLSTNHVGEFRMTVREYLSLPQWRKSALMLKSSECVHYGLNLEKTISPYILGVWLGDGHSDIFAVTTMDKEIDRAFRAECVVQGLRVRREKKAGNRAWTLVAHNNWNNPINAKMHDLGLFANKHIPYRYMVGSVADRLELLAGIIDTDGCSGRETYYEVTSVNERLAEDIVRLARSLGFFAYLRDKIVHGKTYKRISIVGDVTSIPVRLERKRNRKKNYEKNHRHVGFSVDFVGEDDYFGFTVDGDHLFLLDSFFIVHNSALWDAISWAIFGKTVRGAEADDVIHRNFKKNCYVEIDVRHAGKDVKIRRARKHEKFGDRLSYSIHEEEDEYTVVEMGTVALTEAALHQFLGIDFELFRCTILFAQGETFNFVAATDKNQKEILSKVMRLEMAAYQDKVKAEIKNVESIKSDLDRELAVLESHIVEDPSASFKDDLDEWNRKKSEKIRSIESEIVKKGESLKHLESHHSTLTKVSADRSKLGDMINKIQEKITEIQNKRSALDTKIENLDEQAKEFKSFGDVCPTCKKDSCKCFTAQKAIAKANYAATVKSRETCRQDRDKIVFEIAPWNKKMKACREKADDLDDKLLDIRSYEDQKDTCIDRIAELKLELAEVKKEVNPFEDKIEEEIEKQEKIKSTINKTKAKLKESQEKMPYLQFWLTGFGDNGIKSFVFDLVCSTLTNRANRYLSVMTGGSIAISFDTQKRLKSGEFREKFDVVINSGGKEIPYKSYSGGEKRRVSLAVDMALSDLMADYYSSGFNLVVFDEQTNFLDKDGRQNFMKLLRSMAKLKRIFVVDHDGEFKSMFDDVITVEKRGGVSRVV